MRTPQPFWYNSFTTKHCTSQKGEMFSWQKYTSFPVQSATTIFISIVTAEILMGIRSINAGLAITSLHPNARGHRGKLVSGVTRLAQSAGKPVSCIMTMSIAATTVAVINAAIIPSLPGRLLPYPLRPCRLCSGKQTLSE